MSENFFSFWSPSLENLAENEITFLNIDKSECMDVGLSYSPMLKIFLGFVQTGEITVTTGGMR